MSTGIDKAFVQAYYERLTDQEITNVLTQNLQGLTAEAQEIVNAEIVRRKLDPGIARVVESQQTSFNYQQKVFDKDACPVEESVRIWIEQSFQTLLDIFGRENTLNRKVLTPERIDFPVRYDGSERSALETLRIVAKQMEVPLEKITLDFYDDHLREITEGSPGGLYWGENADGRFEISLVKSTLEEPENMVAVIAHEIAHIKLLGENRMAENDERMTDLSTIFFGLGVFNANAAFQTSTDAKYFRWSQSGYLTQMEWGYALALFAYIKKEETPAWAEHLCKNVKADFVQGQNFIAANQHLVFQR